MNKRNILIVLKLLNTLSKSWRKKSVWAKLGGLGTAYGLIKGGYKAYYRVKLKPGERLLISHSKFSAGSKNTTNPKD